MRGFDLQTALRALDRRQRYRRRRVMEGPAGRFATVAGRRLLNFCSNDYLGLAADPRLRAAAIAGIERWGVGAGASHLVSGHTRAHEALERALARFTGRPGALVFSSGYAANVGTIDALVGEGDLVCEDRLNHASLLDGGWLSGAEFAWYPHGDVAALEARLAAHRVANPGGRRLVVTDGTFSMDGDLCPLDALVAVTARQDAWLLVDDAHGIGVHGAGGCGVVNPRMHGTGQVPVLIGTLGKAFGTFGAFVAGDAPLIELLIQRARTYVYSTALPAALAAATLESLGIVESENWRREHLAGLIARFRAGALRLGLDLAESRTPIQPLIVGTSAAALRVSAWLEARELLVTAIRPPTVPEGTARLRVTFSAAHEPGDVDRLLGALEEAVAAGELQARVPA